MESRSFRQKAPPDRFGHPQMRLGPFFSHTNAGASMTGDAHRQATFRTCHRYYTGAPTAGIKNDSHQLAAVSASVGTPLLRLRVDHGDYLAVLHSFISVATQFSSSRPPPVTSKYTYDTNTDTHGSFRAIISSGNLISPRMGLGQKIVTRNPDVQRFAISRG